MKTKHRNLAIAVILAFSSSASAVGIPVIDVSNLAQAVQTVVQLRQQLLQLKQMHDAVTGGRGMGALLNNPQLRQYLPADPGAIYGSGATGSSRLDQYLRDIERGEALSGDLKSDRARLSQREKETLYRGKAMNQLGYESAMLRLDNIEGLARKIDFANDAKAAADLQNRLQNESSLIQSELQRVQLLSMLQKSEESLILHQKREINESQLSTSKTGMPSF